MLAFSLLLWRGKLISLGLRFWGFPSSLSCLLRRLSVYPDRLFWLAAILRLPFCRLLILVPLGLFQIYIFILFVSDVVAN